MCDQGLFIDLTPMRYTHVDQEAATVRVGGGSRWGTWIILLAAIKRVYDPTNFYRVNQNIEPAP